MHVAAASYSHPSNGYPSFLSYVHNSQYMNNSIRCNTSLVPNSGLDLSTSYSNNIKASPSHDANENHPPLSPTFDEGSNCSMVPCKRRSRLVPAEEKDHIYYQKRERNNKSAKRSRDIRRIKEEHIQERVQFLENENTRLSLENQAIRYQISQLHLLCHGVSKTCQ